MGNSQEEHENHNATLKFHGRHVVSLDRASYQAIAGEPVFAHQQGPAGATAVTFRDCSPQASDRQRRPRFGAGLVPRLHSVLTAQGYSVRGVHVPPRWSWTGDQPAEQASKFLIRAEGRLQSLALVPEASERIRLIAEIARLQPAWHILVVEKNNQLAKRVGQRLRAASSRLVTWAPNSREGHPWLHVTSALSLANICTMHWSAVIFMDAELALSATSADYLSDAPGSVHIGFLIRDERQLQQFERVYLESVFGPVIYGPGDELPRTEVAVAWLHPMNKPSRATGTLDRKRKEIWTNSSRNQLIARAARSFSDGNPVGLRMLGLEAAAGYLDIPEQPATVAIVVENVEHGEHLAHLLPEWRLETAGYTPSPGQYVTQDRVIMTLTRAAETQLATDVVLYAAASDDRWIDHTGLINRSGALTRKLIVDVADGHDTRSMKETQLRAAGYQQRGFQELHVTKELSRNHLTLTNELHFLRTVLR